jgi:hypothetical protein
MNVNKTTPLVFRRSLMFVLCLTLGLAAYIGFSATFSQPASADGGGWPTATETPSMGKDVLNPAAATLEAAPLPNAGTVIVVTQPAISAQADQPVQGVVVEAAPDSATSSTSSRLRLIGIATVVMLGVLVIAFFLLRSRH